MLLYNLLVHNNFYAVIWRNMFLGHSVFEVYSKPELMSFKTGNCHWTVQEKTCSTPEMNFILKSLYDYIIIYIYKLISGIFSFSVEAICNFINC